MKRSGDRVPAEALLGAGEIARPLEQAEVNRDAEVVV
jgi:hypothetical protein